MKAPLSFRDARAGDEPGVRSVVATVLGEFGFPVDPNGLDSDLVDIPGSYLSTGGTFKVLVTHDDRIVGCGGLYPLQPTVLELRKMYFLPEARGLGLGKALMSELVDFARREGFERIYLQTASRLTTAAHIYQDAGFRETEPVHPHTPGRSDRAMVLLLAGDPRIRTVRIHGGTAGHE